MPVARRAAPLILVAAALAADARSEHGFAMYAVLAGIPVLAVTGLASFGDAVDRAVAVVDDTRARLEAAAAALALALLVVSGASRTAALPGDPVPAVASSALVTSLAVLVFVAVVGICASLTRDRHPAADHAGQELGATSEAA